MNDSCQRLCQGSKVWIQNSSAEDGGDEKMQRMKREGHDKERLWWKPLERSNSKPGKSVSLRQVLKATEQDTA